MLKELIEKQIFIVNLENMDIADVMWEQEDQDEDYDEKFEDSMHLKELLEHEKLDLTKLEGSKAIISYKNRILSIELEENNTEYKFSMLEFFGHPTYKKSRDTF